MTSRNEYTQMWSKREGAICNCDPQFSFLSTHLHRNPFLCIHSSSIVTSLFLSSFRNLLTRFSFASLSTNVPICRSFQSFSFSLYFLQFSPTTSMFCIILQSLFLFRFVCFEHLFQIFCFSYTLSFFYLFYFFIFFTLLMSFLLIGYLYYLSIFIIRLQFKIDRYMEIMFL